MRQKVTALNLWRTLIILSVICDISETHTHNPIGRRADPRCRSNASLPVQIQVFWPCTSVFWDGLIGIIQLHWLQVLFFFSVFCIFRVASAYSDIPLTLIFQFFACHLEGLMSCLLSREHTAMFLPLQTPSTTPTEIGSQQGSWFIGHFTRTAWGCSTACPTILNRNCQVWRCRSSVNVKAYLHCTVKLSVVTTACLLTFTPKHTVDLNVEFCGSDLIGHCLFEEF